MVNPRTKGSGYEVHVARRFSEWYFKESFKGVRADELPIRRTPLSGGWDKRLYSADLFCVGDPRGFPFAVECKKDETFSWWAVFKKLETTPLYAWWKQATGEAEPLKQLPLLVFTVNFCPDMIAHYRGLNTPGPFMTFVDGTGATVNVQTLDGFFLANSPSRERFKIVREQLYESKML